MFQFRKNIISKHVLLNISRPNGDQKMKIGELIKYNI